MQNFDYYGQSELVRVAKALEQALITAYEESGMTRSDAQGVAMAVVLKAQ